MNPILAQQNHRPWPLPTGPWIMKQQWCDLLFAHWPIPLEIMRASVPNALQLDLWQEQAWVGVVPFRMEGVRPRGVPALPGLSAFPELNVRTYVTMRDHGIDKPGVYFFSLEAANPIAVTIARNLFKLPYFNAEMSLQQAASVGRARESDRGRAIHYRSHRTHRGAPAADFVGTYAPTGPVYRAQAGSIDRWLTERYALYTTDRQGQVYIGEIDHQPWPLQPATAAIETNRVAEASGLFLPDLPPLLHFARHLDVLVWPLRKVTNTIK